MLYDSSNGMRDPVLRPLTVLLSVFVTIVVAIASYAPSIALAGASGEEPLGTEALARATRIAGQYAPGQYGSLSPDGLWFAYSVRPMFVQLPELAKSNAWYTTSGMRAVESGVDLWVVQTRTGRRTLIAAAGEHVEDEAWSPDGQSLAFYSDRDGKARLWVWDRRSGQLHKISEQVVSPMMFPRLRWSPDGRSLGALFLPEKTVSGQRELISVSNPAQSATLSHSTVQVLRAHARADADDASLEAGERPVVDQALRIDSSYRVDPVAADMAIVDFRTGESRRVAKDKVVYWYSFSPDGKWLALSHWSGEYVGAPQAVCDYEVAATSGGDSRVLVRNAKVEYCSASWSPDSQTLAYVTNGPLANGDIHLVNVLSGDDQNITAAPHPTLRSRNPWHPNWSPDGQFLYLYGANALWKASAHSNSLQRLTPFGWNREVTDVVPNYTFNQIWTSDHGRTLTITTRNAETKEVGFFRVDASSGTVTRLREESRSYGGSIGDGQRSPPITSADGTTIVYLAQDALRPTDFWVAGPQLRDAHQLTTLNPDLTRVTYGSSKMVEFLGSRGQRLHEMLVLPAHYKEGNRYPAVVFVYPGPFKHSDNINEFGSGDPALINTQLFATRGYVVLVPEIPQEEVGAPMRDLVEGVHFAVNKVIEMGIADPTRLGVVGHSYGGYAVLAIVSQTQRFKGAVVADGVSDLQSAYLSLRKGTDSDNMNWAEASQGMMGGTLWRYPLRYIENSPVMYLDRIHTPVLVVHGEDDAGVPVSLGDEVFVGLRRLGREVEYRRYRNEEHQPLRLDNRIDYWESAIRWLDTYVKGAGVQTTVVSR